MAFSESVKLEVKKRANFQCCMCGKLFVQVHHIIPQSENGSDDIDNAAPLCAECHDSYGDNPRKRKVIREMRDHWYERCAAMSESPDFADFSAQIDQVYSRLDGIEEKSDEHTRLFGDLKDTVVTYFGSRAEQAAEVSTVSELIQVTGGTMASGSAVVFTDGSAEYRSCPGCGFLVPIQGVSNCPYCGTNL